MTTELQLHKLVDSVVEGTIGRWLKQEGETVAEYEPLLEISTDKVDTEVPSPASGVVLKIMVDEGETVDVGTPLCLIGQSEETTPDSQPEHAANGGQAVHKPHITPVVAKIAAEHDIDVRQLTGTGHGGRVSKKDILAYIEQTEQAEPIQEKESLEPTGMPWDQPGSGDLFSPTEKIFERNQSPAISSLTPPQPAPASIAPPPKPGSTGRAGAVIPMTGLRKAIADHMVLSKRTSPHVTTVMEADCTNMVNFCQRHGPEFEQQEGIPLTYTPIFVSAAIAGLKVVPVVNSVLTDKGIELKRDINIGVAVALDDGLIVPVIKQADSLNLTGLQRAVTGLARKARTRQLSPDDVQNGTFTVSNHGVSGSLFATPIINQPQVGILGVGAVEKRVVVVTHDGVDTIAIKPMCYLSFTFDHRILDGAQADRFLATVKQAVERWQG
jgi:2-oxoglutarate dehydrogenase E2 component (dihydrolipoamide succinyltransferase)